MSMSSHVYGFKPPDEKWWLMKAVWDACRAAGVDPPVGVREFFNHDEPDHAGVVVGEKDLVACGAVSKYTAEMQNGYEVDVTKLPTDVKIIRFVNSY